MKRLLRVLFAVAFVVGVWSQGQPWVRDTINCDPVDTAADEDDEPDFWDGRLIIPADVTLPCVGPPEQHRFLPEDPQFSGRAYWQNCATANDQPCTEGGGNPIACTCRNRNSGWIEFDRTADDRTEFCGDSYRVVRTWTVNCYNSAAFTETLFQTIWYIDDAIPHIVWPEDLDVECGDDLTSAQFPRPLAHDACNEPFTVDLADRTDNTPANCVNNLRSTIELDWVVNYPSDDCGPLRAAGDRSAGHTATINVFDFEPPLVTAAVDDNSLYAGCSTIADATILGYYTFADRCGPTDTITPTLTRTRIDPPNPICSWDFSELARVTAADACGNEATVELTLQYGDVEPPQIQGNLDGGGLVDMTFENLVQRQPCIADFTDPTAFAATDNCTPAPQVFSTSTPWTSTSDHLREWQRIFDVMATDSCGNKSTFKYKQLATNQQNDWGLDCCVNGLTLQCSLTTNGCASNAILIISPWPLEVTSITGNDDLSCANSALTLQTGPGEVYTCPTGSADASFVINLNNPGTLPSTVSTTDITVRVACIDCEDDNLSNNVFQGEIVL